MRDLLSWNIPLGRWAGVNVRLHVFFLAAALMACQAAVVADVDVRWYCPLAFGILFASVLVHEAAHVAAAARLGYLPDQVVLWPFGGLAHISPPHQPAADLLISVMGPLANLMLAAACCIALLLTDPHEIRPFPFDPPQGPFSVALVLALGFWINWMLALVNLLPATPLDGGWALRSALWMRVGYRSASIHAASISRLTGLALLVVGVAIFPRYPFALVPLGLLGCVLFFAPRVESERSLDLDSEEGGLGYDFSQGYTSLERHFEPATTARRREGPLRRWLERRKQARLRRQRHIEEEEDRRVDDILDRLHTYGATGLSPEDRALLNRVSARYRNRERR